ncbi:MAG: hypothetical protein ACXAAR_04060 [Candidatus Thorarchaeota archaeon]|jgi:hypothetical protein
MTNSIRLQAIAIFLLAALTATFAGPPLVDAANPAKIVLRYNQGTQTLFVNVTHQVPNPGNHYVELIEVFKNSVFHFNRTYPEQQFHFGRNDTFSISASSGDNLTVIATCSRGDFLSKSIIVSDSTETTTTTDNTSPTQNTTTEPTGPPEPIEPLDPSIAVGVGFVGAVVFIIAFVMYKEGYVTPSDEGIYL